MKYYLKALSNYANFEGRARRKEFWMFIIFEILFGIVALSIDLLLLYSDAGFWGIYVVYSLAVFIPSLAVAVRRLHDTGNSGWMYFISLIPLVGMIWLLIVFATAGDYGPNQYGPNPIESTPDGALA